MNTPEVTALSAFEHLRHNQRQLDQGGCEVGVSRQALDEVLAEFAERDERIQGLKEHTTFVDKTWYDRYQQLLRRTEKVEAALKSRAVSGDDRNRVQVDLIPGDESDDLEFIIRLYFNRNIRAPIRFMDGTSPSHFAQSILAAGFRRSQESSQEVAKQQLVAIAQELDMGYESPAEPSNGYLTGNNPNGGMVAKESIVGGSASPAEPVKVAGREAFNAACESANGYPTAVNSKPCSWPECELTCNGRAHRISAARALLASGILNRRKLDHQKIIDILWTTRVEIAGYVARPQQSGELNMAAAIKLADALCADTADIWTEE